MFDVIFSFSDLPLHKIKLCFTTFQRGGGSSCSVVCKIKFL